MSYNVYVVAYTGAPRDHHTIFVETNPDQSGYLFQVAGNIQSGMAHNHKAVKKPEETSAFVNKTFIGTVTTQNYGRIASVCNTVPPPKKQFDGPRRINPHEPLRRCQEWNNEAIQALKDANILVPAEECGHS